MTPTDLCSINECRIVHFMIHDRVSFGGSLIAIAILYIWLAAFPLRMGEAWAWWLLAVSAALGFGSFLLYLGYGYLDTWHGVATLALLPCVLLGLGKTYSIAGHKDNIRSLLRPSVQPSWKSAFGIGRCLLLATAVGMAAGGFTIMMVGITTVFVPQDLKYIGLDANAMRAINANLLPLIAHDRAGFGGSVCCCGVTMFFCVWCGTPSRSLWQAPWKSMRPRQQTMAGHDSLSMPSMANKRIVAVYFAGSGSSGVPTSSAGRDFPDSKFIMLRFAIKSVLAGIVARLNLDQAHVQPRVSVCART